MIKLYCDKCGKEIRDQATSITCYARDNLGGVIVVACQKELCEECNEKYEKIKNRLKYPDDIFNMTDEEISLLEYDFKIGDEVIWADGQKGIINDVCHCGECKERGFYELFVTVGEEEQDYITISDKENEFKNFYKIGNHIFGNLDMETAKKRYERTCAKHATAKEQLDRVEYLHLIQNKMIGVKNK